MDFLDRLKKFFTRHFHKQKREVFEPIVLPCRILFITVAFARDFESTGVDLSQYEEKGYGHFFVTTKQSMQEYYGSAWKRQGFSADEMITQSFTTGYPGGAMMRDENGMWYWE